MRRLRRLLRGRGHLGRDDGEEALLEEGQRVEVPVGGEAAVEVAKQLHVAAAAWESTKSFCHTSSLLSLILRPNLLNLAARKDLLEALQRRVPLHCLDVWAPRCR